jgi:hypothetical protein
MKTSKHTRFVMLVALCAVLVCATSGITAIAADADADVTVDKANLCYNEMMHIAISLEVNEVIAEGATLGLIVWDSSAEGELTAENAIYASFEEKTDENGVKYFTSHAIPAPKMGDIFKLAGCIKDADGTIRIGEVKDYSIVDYLNARLADPTSTPLQIDLYNKTLAYGKAAGAVFAK